MADDARTKKRDKRRDSKASYPPPQVNGWVKAYLGDCAEYIEIKVPKADTANESNPEHR